MSVAAVRRALDWRGGSTIDRHVLLAIGGETSHPSDVATLTFDYLAELTGYSRSTVVRAVRRLVEAGALNRRARGGRAPNAYRVAGESYPQPARYRLSVGSAVSRNRRDGDGELRRFAQQELPYAQRVEVQRLEGLLAGLRLVDEPDADTIAETEAQLDRARRAG